jgi:alanyl-tRNA synthetase
MTSEEVRKLFLDFFKKRGHKVVPSSSLIPVDDPSVLLTTAGMQQFKKYFTGEKDVQADFGTQRVTSIQKCFRTTDIEEVGDESHLTFFEMLGNFSFGPVGLDAPTDFGTQGYFKKSAIFWAEEFLEKDLGLKIEYVSVFEGDSDVPFDQESERVWEDLGFEGRIKKFSRADNFWGPTGDQGPCGPTTEIYIDNIEIWNLVFNEYIGTRFTPGDGQAEVPVLSLKPLDRKGVDTGMGFERLMKVLQKTETIFETDLFEPIKARIMDLKPDIKPRDLRIILDHTRGATFLVADGLRPSNLDRGYILRRILRRLALRLKLNNISLNQLQIFIQAVSEKYNQIYPEVGAYDKIFSVIISELMTFEKTLMKTLGRFDREVTGTESADVLGEKLFNLYVTYGLPLELSKELLAERAITLAKEAEERFKQLFSEHQQISKAR